MPCCTIQLLPAIRRIPISNRFTLRTEVLQGKLIHGIAELFASDAPEAVTLAVLVLKDAASHLSCSVFRFAVVETIAVRAYAAIRGALASGDLESEWRLSQKQLIQRVDPLQLQRCMGNVISHTDQYF